MFKALKGLEGFHIRFDFITSAFQILVFIVSLKVLYLLVIKKSLISKFLYAYCLFFQQCLVFRILVFSKILITFLDYK